MPVLLDATGDVGDVRVAEIVVIAHVLTDGGGVERQESALPVMSHLTRVQRASGEAGVRGEAVARQSAKVVSRLV